MSKSTATKHPNETSAATTAANDEAPAVEPGKVIEAPTPLVRDIGVWKRLYIAQKIAEAAETVARFKVFTEMKNLGIEPGGQVISKHGAVPMLGGKAGAPSKSIDWEAVARAGVPADKLDALIAEHTSIITPAATKVHIKAVTGWAAEAKVA